MMQNFINTNNDNNNEVKIIKKRFAQDASIASPFTLYIITIQIRKQKHLRITPKENIRIDK